MSDRIDDRKTYPTWGSTLRNLGLIVAAGTSLSLTGLALIYARQGVSIDLYKLAPIIGPCWVYLVWYAIQGGISLEVRK